MSADLEQLARALVAAHEHLVAAARDTVLKLSAIGAAINGSSFGPRVLELREAKTSKLKTDPRVLRDLKRAKCSVKKCGRAAIARGKCHRHYTAERRARANARTSKPKPKGPEKIMSTKPKSAPAFARNAAVLEPIVTRAASPAPRALGRGVCSECRTVQPLIAQGKRALCRECIAGGRP